jgi:putative PIN family toxin of toxin-antitoxin system
LYVVFDTNVLISRLISKASPPAQAVRWIMEGAGIPLLSEETFLEISEVFSRPKFDAYVSPMERKQFLEYLLEQSEMVSIFNTFSACRDAKDNKFLDVAVAGNADCLITGDGDLLALHPFEGICILSSADFLAKHRPTS